MPSFNNQLHWQGIVATTALILVALAFAGFGYAEWSSKAAFDQFLNTDTPSELLGITSANIQRGCNLPREAATRVRGRGQRRPPIFDAAIIHDGWLKTQLRSFKHGQQRVAEIGDFNLAIKPDPACSARLAQRLGRPPSAPRSLQRAGRSRLQRRLCRTQRQPANRDIAGDRIYFDAIALASGLLSCDQRCAGAGEGVQNYGLPMRTIPDSVRDHGHGLDRRMQAQIIPVVAKAVNTSIAPDVRAISAVLAEFQIVDVGRGA